MTTNIWNRVEEVTKRENGIWFKLAKDGEKAVVVFLGDPHFRDVCFIDGKFVPANDELKKSGEKVSTRISINLALVDTNDVKVCEQGVGFFKNVLEVREKYGLDKWSFEIKRNGAPNDPKTTYSILPEKQLSEEQQKEFRRLKQHDLAAIFSGKSEGKAKKEALGNFDGTIELSVAQQLTQQLKQLPRAVAERFLKEFNIARVKDLPAAAVPKAQEFIKQLQNEASQPPSTDEIDPFAE